MNRFPLFLLFACTLLMSSFTRPLPQNEAAIAKMKMPPPTLVSYVTTYNAPTNTAYVTVTYSSALPSEYYAEFFLIFTDNYGNRQQFYLEVTTNAGKTSSTAGAILTNYNGNGITTQFLDYGSY